MLLLFFLVKQRFYKGTRKFVFNSSKLLPIACVMSLFLPGSSIYFVCHGFPYIPKEDSFSNRIKKSIFFAMLANIKNIICVSKYVKSVVSAELPSSCNLILSINTIEPEVASFLAPRTRINNSGCGSTILTWEGQEIKVIRREGSPLRAVSLAELNANKGIDALCSALSAHREKLLKSFEWHIYGEGRDREHIESIIAEKRLQGIVTLHGFRERAREVLRDFDLLLIPSRNEAFGMVALEAAASGLFVCGSEVGGIKEAIVSPQHGCSLNGVQTIADFVAALVSSDFRPLPPPLMAPDYWQHRYSEWCDIHLHVLLSSDNVRYSGNISEKASSK
jgi:glycosyltransferase involved in cell wall biosynthesis